MMEIRKGSEQDYKAAMLLVVDFTEESLAEYGTYLDPDQLQKTFDAVWKTSFVTVVDEEVVGVLAGHIIEDSCSKLPVYEEIFWFMRRDHREYGLKLLNFVESWCASKGIKRLTMSCMHNSMKEKLFKLYKKLGFRPIETRFIKEIG